MSVTPSVMAVPLLVMAVPLLVMAVPLLVMAGLDPAIHHGTAPEGVAGTRPAMTGRGASVRVPPPALTCAPPAPTPWSVSHA